MKDLTLEAMTRDELLDVIRQFPQQPTAALLKDIRLARLMKAARKKSEEALADMRKNQGVENIPAWMAANKRADDASKEWDRLSKLRYPD